jgi:hypothetical protein
MRTEEKSVPLKTAKAGRGRKRRQPFTCDDPLFKLLGSARSEGPGDVSQTKLEYLVQIYTAKQ